MCKCSMKDCSSWAELSFKACLSRVDGNGLKWTADIKLSYVGQIVVFVSERDEKAEELLIFYCATKQ